MALISKHANLVLIDASPVYTFCAEGAEDALRAYLGDRVKVPEAVRDELKNGATYSAPGSAMKTGLASLCGDLWPGMTLAIPPERLKELSRRRAAITDPDVLASNPGRNLGEIATVIMADHLGADLVIIDDGAGRTIAREYYAHIEVIRTEQLAAEMCAYDALAAAVGQRVASAANNCSRRTWQQLIAFARGDI
jgi:hypothetical protein